MAWMAAIPAIANVASSFIGARGAKKEAKRANRNLPSEAAMPYFRENQQQAHNIFDPYIDQGMGAADSANQGYAGMFNTYAQHPDYYAHMPDLYQNMPNLYEQPSEMSRGYGSMANDPQEYIKKIMRGYTPSEGYKYKEGRMSDAARAAASSGGFAGTRFDQEKRAEMIRGLLGEDQQQYLGNIMGAQGRGLSGLERLLEGRARGQALQIGGLERGQDRRLGGMTRAAEFSGAGRANALGQRAQSEEYKANRGFDAARALAEALIGNNNQMGGVAYQGRNQQNQNTAEANNARTQAFARLINSAPQLMSMFSGGGGGASKMGNIGSSNNLY